MNEERRRLLRALPVPSGELRYGAENRRDTSSIDALPLLTGKEFEEALQEVDWDPLSTMVFHEPESCSFCDAVRAEITRRIDGADDEISGREER